MDIHYNFAIPVVHGRTTGAEAAWELIKPKVEALWAEPGAVLPDWIIPGGVNCTYTGPNGFINFWPEMQPIMDQINAMVKEYYKLLNLDPAFEPYVDEMWVNDVPAGCVGEMHDHPEWPIAGSFYFFTEPDQGSIEIENPAIKLMTVHPRDPNSDNSDILKTFVVNTGDVFLWPGWLRHHVVANKEGRNRISCGFTCLTRPVQV